MGKKGWFSAVKKAVSPSFSKLKKNKRSHKSKSNPKKSCHGNQMSLDTCSSQTEAALANPIYHYPLIKEREIKLPKNEKIKNVTYTTTISEESEDAVSHAAAEVKCMTLSPSFVGKSREEISAIKIQAAYRGYLARKGFQPLRARRRLNLLIQLQGQAVKRQTASTLMCMQSMARVQSQVRARKIRMAEVNEALQRQLIQRCEKVFDKTFDLSPRSKEQVEARLLSKKEAAARRERALAYAYSRQLTWRNSSKSANPTFMDPNYLDWGWSWSERWTAIRPWETRTTNNKESVGDMGKRVSRQPPPSTRPFKALLSVSGQRLKSTRSKGSTKSMNAGSPISNPVPSPVGSGKKDGSNRGYGVGLPKKRHLVSDSPYSGGKRSSGAPSKKSNTIR